MDPLSGHDIRERFLRFFEERGHARLPSDSLVPANDPTLLFTGAGMNQFKDMFLGKGTLPHRRVATAQKCLRVPDLENVGLTPRHHTFFEMLGNFSFGDYFKRECICWEWEFFSRELGIAPERMLASVFQEDDEAYAVWRDEIGLPSERIYRFGEKENFWPAEAPSKGPDGPCGPCSEIYFDLRPEEPLPPHEGLKSLPSDRFVEIGNCVFTQFDRRSDGTLAPLPQKNIDVGLGLERIASVVQGVENNFDTDLFRPLIAHVAARSCKTYGADPGADVRMRRIADHVRAVVFCIADGAIPGNEGRGYVVRKILRRAVRDGYELGVQEPFLHELVDVAGSVMGAAYPEVLANAGQCRALLRSEEQGFRGVYLAGMEKVEAFLEKHGARKWRRGHGEDLRRVEGSGRFAFELHDTYGFPVDITRQIFAERGLALDMDEFEACMEEQRRRARAATSMTGTVFGGGPTLALKERKVPPTVFLGYTRDAWEGTVQGLVRGKEAVESLAAGERGWLVADRTVFYAEGGGQVGDRGTFRSPAARGQVKDCKQTDGYHLHEVAVEEGEVRVGDAVVLLVDVAARRATERNHTATHLLHKALKVVLGDQVAQAGSLVAPDRLRFDFTHTERLSGEQIRAVEDLVNRRIMDAIRVQAEVRPMEEARKLGFIAMFGEKYGDEVRTLSVADFSRELCGGTHVPNTGTIGPFRIVSEGSVAAGIRRIEAITGEAALEAAWADRQLLQEAAARLKAQPRDLPERVEALLQEVRQLRKQGKGGNGAAGAGRDAAVRLLAAARDVGGARLLLERVEGLDQDALKAALEALAAGRAPYAAFLFSVLGEGRVALASAASQELVDGGFHAGEAVRDAAALLGGRGGGRPGWAQGQGRDASRLEEAMALVRSRMEGAAGARGAD